ncbi:MAG: PQQ-binding-like beta-propeller repeat protein [Bryobacterales bacterium]|nr:PQQ-binding-like beta-propeller repeat protein [Bryobacterales bacterium]
MRKSLLLAALAATPLLGGDIWPGFRGDGTSLASAGDLPVAWSDSSNVAWSVALEGYGQSSPVIRQGTVYVTSAVGPNKETLVTAAYRFADGKLLWADRRPSSAPAEAHERMAKAAPTPVAGEDGLYAFFESGDLIALDYEGKQRWARFLPEEGESWTGNHGLGSSPVLSGERLFLHIAPVGKGRLYAIESKDGRDAWVRDLPPSPSFSTPVAIQHEGRSLLLTTAGGGAAAYDMDSGEEVFRRPVRGGRGYAVPSASVTEGLVVIASGESKGTHSFRLDVPDTTLWSADKATTEFSSPVIAGGRAWLVNSVGVLFELDLLTGEELSTRRLPSGCWATGIADDERLYFFGVDGAAAVLSQSSGEILATSDLSIKGRVYGVAAADAAFIVRTGDRLLRISNDP